MTALFDKNGQPNQALFDRIPDGVIVEIARPDWDLRKDIGTKLDLSHMGLALRIHGDLIFRQASTVEKKVADVPLATYLARYLKSPTVKGIHLEKII